MPVVKCSVSNCTYWGSGNICTADAIMVEIDRHARASFREEIGEIQVDSGHKDVAQSSSDTCCHTFKPRQ